MTRPVANRLLFLDAARSLAIFGALLIHCLLVFDVWEQVPAGFAKAMANGFFRSCTPVFFLLFGVMVELIYTPRALRTGLSTATIPLLKRSGSCWLGLFAGILAAAVAGNMSWENAALSALNLADAPLVSVLRFYTIAMALMIPVIALRCRFGRSIPWLLVGLIWMSTPLLNLMAWPEPKSSLAFLSGFLFGYPPVWVGGSVFHNMGLVLAGVGIGQLMHHRMERGLQPFGGRGLEALTLAGLGGLCFFALQMGPMVFLRGYLGDGMTLRGEHHPAYYLTGGVSALALFWILQKMIPTSADPLRIPWPVLTFGRYPLISFILGNVLLNLMPRRIEVPLAVGIGASLAFLIGLLLFVRQIESRRPRS
jgi:hypothetical protein